MIHLRKTEKVYHIGTDRVLDCIGFSVASNSVNLFLKYGGIRSFPLGVIAIYDNISIFDTLLIDDKFTVTLLEEWRNKINKKYNHE